MSRKGRILVEHDGETCTIEWETVEENGAIEVKYTYNGKRVTSDANATVIHGNPGVVQWLNDMIMCDIMEHTRELSNADTQTDGFPDVEPISARMKPDNDMN